MEGRQFWKRYESFTRISLVTDRIYSTHCCLVHLEDNETNDEVLIDEEKTGTTETCDRYERSPAFVTFDCTEANCVMQFRREDRLRAHLLIGSHKFVTSSSSLLDKAILMYKETMINDDARRIPSMSTASIAVTPSSFRKSKLEEGWALFQPRPNVKFTLAQKTYLNEKYDEGEKSGGKWDPNRLAEVRIALVCDFEVAYAFRLSSTCK